jgi:adenylate kinase
VRVILLGPPGAGKGTQAHFICEHFSIPKISTGDILRQEIATGSKRAEKLKKIMDNGDLVEDKIIIEIVKDRLKQDDCKQGFLFDGFPRNIEQAKNLVDQGINVDFIIDILVDDIEIIKRLSGRRIHLDSGRTYHIDYNPPQIEGRDDLTGDELVQRDDDQEQAIRNRLQIYHKSTQPLLDWYQDFFENNSNKLIKINGMQPVEEIKAQILSIFAS